MRLSEYETLKKILPLLQKPRVIPSKAELAKRAKLSDDTLGRHIENFEREHGWPLIAVENGRLTLTERGRRAYELYSEIWSLGNPDELALTKLKLQVESILGPALLSQALVAVFELWGSAIDRPSIWRLDPDIRRGISEGKTDLGLGFADTDESIAETEALGPPVSWCVLAPIGHRLGEARETMSVDQLPKEGWLLLPDLAFGAVGLADTFVKAGHRQVMECDHLVQYVSANVGLAILPDVLGSRCPHGTIKRRLAGLPPIQVRLFLPRGGETALSSPNQSLVENLRRLMQQGLSGGDNGIAASTAASKSEPLEARREAEDVFEALCEDPVTPMEEVLS